MAHNILIVEDNRDIANLISLHLRDLDCDIAVANDGLSGLEATEKKKFELIILDLMLPGMDGLEICRRIRQKQDYTPILMLTSKSAETDRVVGLEMGADDYLTKPFSVRELVARVKALFRRVDMLTGNVESDSQIIQRGPIQIDLDKHEVLKDDKRIDLTAKEFDLLSQFIRNPGRVYSRVQLLDMVWGYGHDGYEHTVNSHINRLRSKIESDAANPEIILTVWGVGYKFNESL
ncbi:MAG: response regulator transcription factor [Gammaproteobacteria bacterium]|nr:response regulator transcription factor [Gammaproteobacteria bacterium]MDH5728605.1 response regulator transcription factor [Gammaproteobacteria bacterium]